jgi:pimeloyl-ACP methyl ester carboxylesterase
MESAVSRDGTEIGFSRSGAGPALLLVHGTTADRSRWDGVSPALEERFTVYAMDRRGRGLSGDAAKYSIMREAEDVVAVIEAIGGLVSVLGHSYGAACSLEACLLTDQIGRLVLYEPPLPTGLPMYPTDTPDRMQGLLDQGERELALEMFFREVVRMPEDELRAFRELSMWQRRIALTHTVPREMVIDRVYRFDPERFSHLQVPTLLVLGGDSPETFRRPIEALEKALPVNRVVVLPGQGHAAMDAGRELFLREVMGFLMEDRPAKEAR